MRLPRGVGVRLSALWNLAKNLIAPAVNLVGRASALQVMLLVVDIFSPRTQPEAGGVPLRS